MTDQKPTPDAREQVVAFLRTVRSAGPDYDDAQHLRGEAERLIRLAASSSLPDSGERYVADDVPLLGPVVIGTIDDKEGGVVARCESDEMAQRIAGALNSALPHGGERERVRRALADRLYNGRTISTTFEEAEGFADELLALLDTYRPSSDGGEREAEARRLIEARPTEAYSASDATASDYEAMLEYANALEDHLRAGLGGIASSSPPAGGEGDDELPDDLAVEQVILELRTHAQRNRGRRDVARRVVAIVRKHDADPVSSTGEGERVELGRPE